MSRTVHDGSEPGHARTRVDQWLWFARFAKSRSLAARLCAAGAIKINGGTVKKPNQALRVGDVVVLPQGGWERTVRVLGLGTRRGPASQARLLYEETGARRLNDVPLDWVPLIVDDEAAGRAVAATE